MEPKCGRPLGLRRLDAENILAIDTYLGIFSVNFNAGNLLQQIHFLFIWSLQKKLFSFNWNISANQWFSMEK